MNNKDLQKLYINNIRKELKLASENYNKPIVFLYHFKKANEFMDKLRRNIYMLG